jgi:hypothetical protein
MSGIEEPGGRARSLMELGLMVERSGVLPLVEDDRTVVLGAMLEAAERLAGTGGAALIADWRARAGEALEDGLVLSRLSEHERA